MVRTVAPQLQIEFQFESLAARLVTVFLATAAAGPGPAPETVTVLESGPARQRRGHTAGVTEPHWRPEQPRPPGPGGCRRAATVPWASECRAV